MQDVIKVKPISYQRYEELLIKKEKLLKEAEMYKIQYNEIFNALNNDTYEARMDCVKKRKTVLYCQNMTDMGSLIYKKDLEVFIDDAMKEYKDTLSYILGNEEKDTIKKKDDGYIKQIKTIYRQLARLVHPDMNSDLKENRIVQDLWNRTCIAYNCSNLEELEELEILINKYLESINHSHIDIEIPNVDEKIFILNRQIEKIKHTNPYQYKYIIGDEKIINAKKEELQKELDDYKRYSSELDKEISLYVIVDEEK